MATRHTKTARGRRSGAGGAKGQKLTRAGRARMQVLVNPQLLDAAVEAAGGRSKSDTIELALRNLSENAAILRGIDAAIGMAPDFPDVD